MSKPRNPITSWFLRRATGMRHPDPDPLPDSRDANTNLAHELQSLIDALVARGPVEGSPPRMWPTIVKLAESAEGEMAIENLCRHVAYGGYTITHAEYADIQRMATDWNVTYEIEEYHLENRIRELP